MTEDAESNSLNILLHACFSMRFTLSFSLLTSSIKFLSLGESGSFNRKYME